MAIVRQAVVHAQGSSAARVSDTRFRRYFAGPVLVAGLASLGLACTTFGAAPADASPVEAGRSSESNPPQPDAAKGGASPAAPDPATPASSCPGAAACERVVFVTSDRMLASEIGGMAAADALCTKAAADSDAAPRVQGRQFVAWLSDDTTSASARMVHGTGAYVRPDGKPIASDWAALTSGAPLASPLAIDELGEAHDSYAWTGTGPSGVAQLSANCAGWRGGPDAVLGLHGLTGSAAEWTRALDVPLACDIDTAHLYCFEK